ncbi:MAG: ATP synthase F1 subunit delta [Gaiellaceae bacterium]
MSVAPRMYARSLFQAARDAGRLDAVHAELGEFVTAVEQVPELRGLLSNPQIERDERSAALREILADADELVRNFVLLLSEKGRTAQLDEVYRELDALVAAEAGRLTVELTTAYELSDDEAASIVEKIEQSSGRTVEATRSVDAGLIGGIVLQVGSHRLDASVRGRLNRLRHELVTRS